MERDLTFGEIFMAIRDGDVMVALGFGLECLIMLSPVAIFWLALHGI